MLNGADPHDVLGVRRGASPDQVTRAFHRRALGGGHPDTGGDAQAFRRLVVARDALLEPRTAPSATPRPPRPRPQASTVGAHTAHTARPAPSSDASALPLIVLGFLFLVGVPHVLLALVLMLVP